ncbi:AraC family transcriptional regulator [Cocleimonas sp. KMM 6892]|uniref:AraC family transcriptional regulator n=1 Tax=unclassified Cocleimonas TaxID=2639732 RepID=UPI002DBA7EC2|nr:MULTISPECIES: AraC family transcriptional regulator [unclassified Cocleimonas]MEB8432772.1 AraC family transcriptional regulator [Cocleimonas sp. KMM 6892]MEC4715631.1 AraC family transcriptional regulator [Cocleimonas sp. KMM 6895]MEC4744751.1 AraC family transcriptional regulator [Cocleimonas sp. KMM 6896]
MRNNASKYTPSLEQDFQRNSTLGYEPEGSYGFLRCLEHGAPNDLIRWHHHEEYELHLITSTKGKMFVGDYIGTFKPGNLVLTGPRLPHNWISTEIPKEGVARRDFVLQFLGEPLRKASDLIPELQQAMPLLTRAKNGIEFFGISDFTEKQLSLIKNSSGLRRFNAFLELMLTLSEHSDYKLLSNTQIQSFDNDASMRRISEVVDYITENYSSQFSMADIAKRTGMDSSQFSRYFSKASGNTFTGFVNRLRINKACQLLMETDQYISTICYHVGYNNVANFNRRFIEIKNMTPSDYRKQSKNRFKQ